MKKVATILANGFEEIEALTIVDVLRRAGIDCDTIGFEESVTGSHQITVEVDRLWNGDLSDYDAIFLPGGMPGAANLRDHEELIAALQAERNNGKTISAICAAPIVLARAGLLKGKNYTCYDGFEQEIQDGHYLKETVVKDGNLLTSRGPSTALALAYALVDHLGGDAQGLREGMLYQDVFGDK